MLTFGDRQLGLTIAALGAAIVYLAARLPGPVVGSHIAYGPGFFPSLLGAATTVAGLCLVAKPPAVDGNAATGPSSETRERPRIIGPALVLGAMLAYVGLSELVGFLPISILILVCLLALGGMRIVPALLLSVFTSVAIYLLFSKGLLVPLPRGLLQPLAAWL